MVIPRLDATLPPIAKEIERLKARHRFSLEFKVLKPHVVTPEHIDLNPLEVWNESMVLPFKPYTAGPVAPAHSPEEVHYRRHVRVYDLARDLALLQKARKRRKVEAFLLGPGFRREGVNYTIPFWGTARNIPPSLADLKPISCPVDPMFFAWQTNEADDLTPDWEPSQPISELIAGGCWAQGGRQLYTIVEEPEPEEEPAAENDVRPSEKSLPGDGKEVVAHLRKKERSLSRSLN